MFPASLLQKIKKLKVLYTLDHRLTKMRFGVNFKPFGDPKPALDILPEVARFPRAIHPAVWVWETGEKVLYVSSWMAVGVEHDEDAAGDALLDEVCHEIIAIGERGCAYWAPLEAHRHDCMG